jgi:hypothetical protein
MTVTGLPSFVAGSNRIALIWSAGFFIFSSRNPLGASVVNDSTCPWALIVIANTTWFVPAFRSFEAAASHIADGPSAVSFVPLGSLLCWALHNAETAETSISKVANLTARPLLPLVAE